MLTKYTHFLAAAGLLTLTSAAPLTLKARTSGEFFTSGTRLDPSDIYDGAGSGVDAYTLYSGDGTVAAGWPAMSEWASFDNMFNSSKPMMRAACPDLNSGAGDSGDEIGQIWNAIQSAAFQTNVDHRFILAIIAQESKFCTRIHTTVSPDGTVRNPGLMQDHNGGSSCNVNGVMMDPCPDSEIFGMIYEGTAGTASGMGLAGALKQAGGDTARTYYEAARIYNSGSVSPSDLNDGLGSTNCYATDVANRLMGWLDAPSECTLDVGR